MQNKENLFKWLSIGFLGIGLIALAIVIYFSRSVIDFTQDAKEPTSFESCVAMGYAQSKSVPKTCQSPTGKIYTETMSQKDQNSNNEEDLFNEIATSQNEINTDLPTSGNSQQETLPQEATATFSIFFFDQTKFDTPDNTNYLTPISRSTTRKDVATYSLEQIILGPSIDEQNAYNLKTTFGKDRFIFFTSNSNCSGKDFSISIGNGDATIRFCRNTSLTGDMSGFIVEEQIDKTLKQFSSIKRVRMLNANGDCINNMSGLESDQCWK